MNFAMKILFENAKSFKERDELHTLTEADSSALSNEVVAKLYQSIVNKSHVDFGSIPSSKGRVEKYEGTSNMIQTLDILEDLNIKSGAKTKDLKYYVEIVKDAIVNLSDYGKYFEAGYKTNNDYCILVYNSMLLACIEATSYLVSSYIDSSRRVDGTAQFVLIQDPKRQGEILLENLSSFNRLCKSGDLGKSLKQSIANEHKNFTGTALVTAVVAVGISMSIIPLMRELIFLFYYSRMKVSDYLEQQALFLEANKLNILNNAGLDSKKRSEIIAKQNKTIDRLRSISDKISVEYTLANSKSKSEMNKENNTYTLKNIQSSLSSHDSNGVQLL